MAIDIMQTLVELLCPTYGAQSACQNFINNPYHQVIQPLGPLIYFLFFPTVFLILLIYIGTGVVLRGNVSSVKGLRLLLSVAVLVAIIIQGYYPMILWLSDLWFLLLPLIFVLFFIIRHFGGGGGGGGPMWNATKTGWFSKAKEVAWRKATGMEKADAAFIENQIIILENTDKGAHGIDEISGRIDGLLRNFYDKASIIPGIPLADDYNHLVDRYRKACEKKNLPVRKDLTKIDKKQARRAAA